MKPIGPTFGAELEAAGLSQLPISWCPDGTILNRGDLTPEEDDALDIVLEAHDSGVLDPSTVSNISRRQFWSALALPPYELVSREDALLAIKTGAIPVAVKTILDNLTGTERFLAEGMLSGADTFLFEHPTSVFFGDKLGWEATARADFFNFAAQL